MSDNIKVSITQAIRIMVHRLRKNPHYSFLLIGAPGVAKTAMCDVVAAALNRELTAIKIGDKNPEMLGGYPHGTNETLEFYKPSWIPTQADTSMLLIDEIGHAPTAVQNVVMSAAEKACRKIGEHKLPDGTVVVMAMNKGSHRAGSVDLHRAFESRFDCRLEIHPEKDEFIDYAAQEGFNAMLIAWVQSQLTSVVDFDPREKGGFLTLRTLEQASDAINDYDGNFDNPDLKVNLYSTLGDNYANQLIGFGQAANSLPEYPDILANPETTEAAVAMAQPIGKLIANNIRYAHVPKVLRYIRRYPEESQATMVTLLQDTSCSDHPDVEDIVSKLGLS